MEDVSVAHAKEHLEELVARAARGEEISIVDPKVGKVKLTLTGTTVTRARKPRQLGLLEGKMKVPARLLEPITDEEFADWYGDLPTHVVFWATMDRTRLSPAARTALESEQNDVVVSVASAWEIAIKVGLGKWPEARDLLLDFERHMDEAGFEILPVTVAHVRTAGLMGAAHRDPFDRVQATIDGLVLVTADSSLATLGAACIW